MFRCTITAHSPRTESTNLNNKVKKKKKVTLHPPMAEPTFTAFTHTQNKI